MTGILNHWNNNYMKMYAYLLVLLPMALAQYNVGLGMKPDVRFDERNERFDIGALAEPGEYAEEDFRRQGMRPQNNLYDPTKNTKNILRLINRNIQQNTPAKKAIMPELVQLLRQIARRAGSEIKITDWAWHDDMKHMEDQVNFEKNLDKFRGPETKRDLVGYLHGEPASLSRRSGVDPDREILLHHAVPIVMKVQGFLKAPVGDEVGFE